jgi:hypothetical protein
MIVERNIRIIDELRRDPSWLTLALLSEGCEQHLPSIRDLIFEEGFDIIREIRLPEEARGKAVDTVKKGLCWAPGRFGLLSGEPALLLAIYDYSPPGSAPSLGESHLERLMRKLAHLSNRGVDSERRSSRILFPKDDEAKLYILALLAHGEFDDILEEGSRLKAASLTPYPVIGDLSRNLRRAKIELVSFEGKDAVCKTYLPGREEFLRREALAREIGSDIPEVSHFLELGSSYMVLERYKKRLPEREGALPLFLSTKFIPLPYIERIREVLAEFRSRGFELIDFNPRSIFLDDEGVMKFIDFEFFQEGGARSRDLVGCMAWYPVPEGFSGALPKSSRIREKPYTMGWFSRTGLPLGLCARWAPRPVLHAVRFFSGQAILCRRVAERLRLSGSEARS